MSSPPILEPNSLPSPRPEAFSQLVSVSPSSENPITQVPPSQAHVGSPLRQSIPLESPRVSITESATTDASEVEQAAVGRLTSMSLIAAVAASVELENSIQEAFVAELDNIDQDPVYWVRREACYALGALAKVVPAELVQLSLLPLLKKLLTDPHDQVRLASVFALPAVLSRLPEAERRELATETLHTLSHDESAEVRLRMLESLGEVIFTFHNECDHLGTDVNLEEDEGGGPPKELLQMFLGSSNAALPSITATTTVEPSDSARPLIMAFNLPAVALVLGGSRWAELRGTYLDLTKSSSHDVQRTLSASIGELAKIIGTDQAGHDLLDVWHQFSRSEEDDVRMRLVESLKDFYEILDERGRLAVMQQLLSQWESMNWRAWREREGIARCLVSFIDLAEGSTKEALDMLRKLLLLVLCDGVSAVREAGIATLPKAWLTFNGTVFDALRCDVESLGMADTYRRRMTYVACKQALIIPSTDQRPAIIPDDYFWESLHPLIIDPVISVRIGVARLVKLFCDNLRADGKEIPPNLLSIADLLHQDGSKEVRDFTVLSGPSQPKAPWGRQITRAEVWTFSRPPPVPQRTGDA